MNLDLADHPTPASHDPLDVRGGAGAAHFFFFKQKTAYKMDEAITQYIKRKYNLLIGERTAEAIKIELGSAFPLDEELSFEVRGRNLIEGIPKTITISDEEIREALADSV